MAGAHQPGLTHQACNPVAAMLLAAYPQIGVDPRNTMGLARVGMHCPGPQQQRRFGTVAWLGGGRPRQAWKPALDTPCKRAMAEVRKLA